MTAVSIEVAGSLRERATREYEREIEKEKAKRLAERNESANLNLKNSLRWLSELGIYDPGISVNEDGTRVETIVDGVRLFYACYLDDEWGWQTEMGVVVQCAKCRGPLYLPARDLVAIGHALSEPFEHGDHRALPKRYGVSTECQGGDVVATPTAKDVAMDRAMTTQAGRELLNALRAFFHEQMGAYE